MTKKYFIVCALAVMKNKLIALFIALAVWHCLSLQIQRQEWQRCLKAEKHKHTVLLTEFKNRQWEVDRARGMKRELDELRWMRRATELRHADWALITKTIYRKSREYGLRPDLVLAIAHRESNFQPYAASFCAMGILQINYNVWKDTLNLTLENIYDIENNIDAGCMILRMYLNETGGDEAKALLYYNCGYRLSNPRYVPRIQSSKFYGGK